MTVTVFWTHIWFVGCARFGLLDPAVVVGWLLLDYYGCYVVVTGTPSHIAATLIYGYPDPYTILITLVTLFPVAHFPPFTVLVGLDGYPDSLASCPFISQVGYLVDFTSLFPTRCVRLPLISHGCPTPLTVPGPGCATGWFDWRQFYHNTAPFVTPLHHHLPGIAYSCGILLGSRLSPLYTVVRSPNTVLPLTG